MPISNRSLRWGVPGGERASQWIGALFVAGGLVALLYVIVPHPPGLDPGPVVAVGAVACVLGAALIVAGPWVDPVCMPWLAAVGTALVTAASYFAGPHGGGTSVALIYGLVAVYVGALPQPVLVVAELAWLAVAYGACLAAVHTVGAPGQWVTVVAVSIVVATITHLMVRGNRRLALRDALTGLPNRQALDDALAAALAIARRRRLPVCLAVLDLDMFKQVNARFGHPGADALLVGLVERWRRALRGGDLLFRYGGDEFVVLLPFTDLEGAKIVAERLQGAATSDLGVSVGLAAWDGTEEPHQLINRADAYVFEAKNAGRGRVVAEPRDPALAVKGVKGAAGHAAAGRGSR